jgi:hypothetical protein
MMERQSSGMYVLNPMPLFSNSLNSRKSDIIFYTRYGKENRCRYMKRGILSLLMENSLCKCHCILHRFFSCSNLFPNVYMKLSCNWTALWDQPVARTLNMAKLGHAFFFFCHCSSLISFQLDMIALTFIHNDHVQLKVCTIIQLLLFFPIKSELTHL